MGRALARQTANNTPPARGTVSARGERTLTALRLVDRMIADVVAVGGSLEVDDDRGYYDNLVSSATRYGKVPEGGSRSSVGGQANTLPVAGVGRARPHLDRLALGFFTVTGDGPRLLQDLRQSILEPSAQLPQPETTAAAALRECRCRRLASTR